jgi:LytS/YehU family sensor histidine kinase
MRIRILLHISFWAFFTFLFYQQNPEAGLLDYFKWLSVLGISAAVVYVNLYILFPKYFFKKKYLIYSLILTLILTIGAFILRVIFPVENSTFAAPILQNIINLFFFVVITSSFKFYREYTRKQELLILAENEQLKTELSLLKSQVNPHFLFNTLNNLYGLIIQNQNTEASEITLKLSDLMRYILKSSKDVNVSLRDEIKFIEDYLAIEKIRLAKNVQIKFEFSGLEKDILIAPLLFIPLIENVFKHGMQNIAEENFAHLFLSKQGNEVFFEVHNSIGRSINKQIISGTGLNNLRKRLQLIYPHKHQLEINKTETNFKAILYVQL